MRIKRPPPVKGVKLKAGKRSLGLLRKRGLHAEVVEKYVAFVGGKAQAERFAGGYRKDLFGFIDILAFDHCSIVAVQTTSRAQMTAHLRSYRRDPELAERIMAWIAEPTRHFILHGWECVQRPTSRGGVKAVWECSERVVGPEDLEDDSSPEEENRPF